MKTVTCPNLRKGQSYARLFCPGFLLIALLLPSLSSQKGLIAAPKSKDKDKPYALIAGTVWGPDDRPVYGVTVKIRRATDKAKKARWQLYSDHMGEFAQRVPVNDDLPAANAEKAAEIDHGRAHHSGTIDDDIDDAAHVLIGRAADVAAEYAVGLPRADDGNRSRRHRLFRCSRWRGSLRPRRLRFRLRRTRVVLRPRGGRRRRRNSDGNEHEQMPCAHADS